jgi:hypothetical protein
VSRRGAKMILKLNGRVIIENTDSSLKDAPCSVRSMGIETAKNPIGTPWIR